MARGDTILGWGPYILDGEALTLCEHSALSILTERLIDCQSFFLGKAPPTMLQVPGNRHTRINCQSSIDQTGLCFNCGRKRHQTFGCRTKSHCPVCVSHSINANHKAGTAECPPYNGGPDKQGESAMLMIDWETAAEEKMVMDFSDG